MLENVTTSEKVGIFVALAGIIGGSTAFILKAIGFHFRIQKEHELLMNHLRVEEEIMPRFIATEEAVGYLKEVQKEQLIELRCIRTELGQLMSRLIDALEK